MCFICLTQEQLAHISLPLGGLRKTEVREIAEKHGFINARKHDSQDICFVPDGDYAKFIEQYTGRKSKPGDFVDMEGNILGQTQGNHSLYTWSEAWTWEFRRQPDCMCVIFHRKPIRLCWEVMRIFFIQS